jgi:hypothetical protein
MGKRYIRKRGKLYNGNHHKFTCTQCGAEFMRKDFFKQHWEEKHSHAKSKIDGLRRPVSVLG